MRHTHNLSSPKSSILDKNTSPPPLAMPRSILLQPPGGASGKVRTRYALIEKLTLLDESNRLQRDCNLSLRQAAEVIGTNCSFKMAKGSSHDPCCHRGSPVNTQQEGHSRWTQEYSWVHRMDLLQFVFAKPQFLHARRRPCFATPLATSPSMPS
jgi:hypothetical protein